MTSPLTLSRRPQGLARRALNLARAPALFVGPLRAKLQRASLETVADSVTEIAPAEPTEVPPAVMLDGQIERMKPDPAHTSATPQTLALHFLGGPSLHCATRAFHFRRASLFAGSVYANGASNRLRPLSESLTPLSADRDAIDGAALCTSVYGERYFGHYLMEDIPQTLLASPFGAPLRLSADPAWRDAPEYDRRFGVEWSRSDFALIRNLTIFEDIGQNANRRERYRRLQARIREVSIGGRSAERVYLRRGGAEEPWRCPLNEAALHAALLKRGYVTVDTRQDSTSDIIETLLGARVVVSLEGSHTMHALYTIADNSAFLLLMPPLRPQTINKEAFDAIGACVGLLVGREAEGGFNIDLDELDRTLDLVEAKAR